MPFLLTILVFLQAAPPSLARGDRFQVAVPQGWKVTRAAADVSLEHSSGASLAVRRARQAGDIDTFARTGAERVMAPLGFAKLGAPRKFQDSNAESVQYEVRGNRLSERRRILYRVVRRDASVFEVIYENSEDGFDILITEAQSIAGSLQVLIDQPPLRRRQTR